MLVLFRSRPSCFPGKPFPENVELPLVLRGVEPTERRRRVTEALTSVGLDGFEQHYPSQLSGGMQKRGSIARNARLQTRRHSDGRAVRSARCADPNVMQHDLQSLALEAEATVVFVTHDITEAVLLADNVVVLSQRPSRLLTNVAIEIPTTPRNVFEPFRNPGFEATYEAVWSAFRSQINIGNRLH